MTKVSLNQGIENILSVYGSGSNEDRKAGRNWYPEANRWCTQQSKELGVSVKVFAAITAALSPACRWERNKIDAANLIRFNGNVKVCTYNTNKNKAIAIMRTGNVGLLSGPKVVAFYNCMLQPDIDMVVVDRHAMRIYEGSWEPEGKPVIKGGVYEKVCEAYRHAASITNETPAALQASTWTIFRNSLLMKAA